MLKILRMPKTIVNISYFIDVTLYLFDTEEKIKMNWKVVVNKTPFLPEVVSWYL